MNDGGNIMIKKNQLALIFLTVVTMLAVWYIRTPLDKDTDDDDLVSGLLKKRVGCGNTGHAVIRRKSIVAMGFDAVWRTKIHFGQQGLPCRKKALSALTEKGCCWNKSINIDACLFIHERRFGNPGDFR